MADDDKWSVRNPDAKDTVLRIIETNLGNSGYELPEGDQLKKLNDIVDETIATALDEFECPLPNKGQNNQLCPLFGNGQNNQLCPLFGNGQNNQLCPTIGNQSGYERRRVQKFCHEHTPCDARDIAHMCWFEIFAPNGIELEYA
jgi:hypothetical protein